MRLAEKLKNLREARELSQEQLAAAAGVTQNTIAKIELGKSRRTRYAAEIAAALGVSADELAGDEPPPSEVRRVPEADAAPNRGGRDVPVLGTAVAGVDADFYMNGEAVDYVRRLPGIERATGVFAVHVASDCLSPKFEPGDLVYVHPNRPPNVGDIIIIEMQAHEGERNGKAYVKRLVRRSASRVIAEQFNPPKTIEFDTAEIKGIYRVIPLNELVGF